MSSIILSSILKDKIGSSQLPPPTTSSWPTLIALGADTSDDPVVFNIGVSGAAILLKPGRSVD